VPNLAFEIEQLETANRHILTAEQNLVRMRERLAAVQKAGGDTALLERTLRAAESGLKAFQEHRGLIVRTIDDIRAGRIPST